MKRIIILALMSVSSVLAFGQVKVYTDQLIADSVSTDKTNWVNEFSKDGTMAGNSDRAVPTEKAIVTYLQAQIASLVTGVDTATVIDLISSYLDTVVTELNLQPDLTGDTLLTSYNGGYGYRTIVAFAKSDSITDHMVILTDHEQRLGVEEDSSTAYDNRLGTLETDSHSHDNKVSILDNTTAIFTTAKDTRLSGVNDTILVMIPITTDTLTSTNDSTGWIFPINRVLDGCNLISVEAFSPDNGSGTASIRVLRKRSSTVATVTSVGADINGTATIDTNYDDVALSDYYNIVYRETGTSDFTVAVDVYLKFIRP